MLDDMFDVVETAVDVGEAVLHTLKKGKRKRNSRRRRTRRRGRLTGNARCDMEGEQK